MLIGRFEGKIDEKSRIGFPKKFRGEIGEQLIITYGFEGSLLIVSHDAWESLLSEIEQKPFTKTVVREMQRYMLGGAQEVTLDGKGRLLLPLYLKEHAQITDDVVFLGLTRYVELWDKRAWETHHETIAKSISFIAERLGGKEHE